jgi:Tfp pilus assembly major pilin PilA
MNLSPKRQQGLTFISLAILLGIIGFTVLLALKIGPIYLDHSKVVSTLDDLKKTTGLEDKSEAEIRDTLNKRFSMNYIDQVTQNNITILRQENYLKIAIEYEVVKNIVGNLSVLVEFNDVMEVGKQ